jgi:creatinine amidohydrolase
MDQDVDWSRLTAPDLRAIAASRDALAVLPVGSLEQHGPHLPTITDTRTAWEAAIRGARLASARGVPVVVLPGLWTGMSEHHLPFGGTISLTYAEFHGVLTGIVRSLRALGFGRLLIVNGHGGNEQPLSVAVRELAVAFGMAVVAVSPWDAAAPRILPLMETAGGPMHACEAEASVMLAMAPDTVRPDRFEEAVRQAPPAVRGRAPFTRFWSFAERAPATGVRGDPRPATADKGERMLAAMAEALADSMADPGLWTRPDAVWSAGRGLRDTTGAVQEAP